MTAIDRLRKLREAATPGRWDRDGDAFGCAGVQLGMAGEADSELIVAAVNALTLLLDLVEDADRMRERTGALGYYEAYDAARAALERTEG